MQALRDLIEAKVAEMAKTIALRRDKSVAAALNLMQTDRGEDLMTRIRAEFGVLETAELNDLREETSRAAYQTETFHYTSLCLIALAILLTGLASLLLLVRRNPRPAHGDHGLRVDQAREVERPLVLVRGVSRTALEAPASPMEFPKRRRGSFRWRRSSCTNGTNTVARRPWLPQTPS